MNAAEIRSGVLACGAAVSFAGMAMPLHVRAEPAAPSASQSAGATTTEVPEVIVTARRRAEALSRTPVVATAVTGQELEKEAVRTITALSQIVPDVYISTGFTLDTMFIQGVGASGSNSGEEQSVALFIDGVYLGNGHWLNAGYIDVDTAQILKGPQGVYFGKNTIAGAVDLTTNSPGPIFEGYVKGGYEFNARERYVDAVVSGPLGDTFGARLAIHATKMDGWGRAFGVREPGIRDVVGRLTLAWRPTSRLDATLKVQLDDYHDTGPVATAELLDCPGGKPSLLGDGFNAAGNAPCVRGFNFSALPVTRLGRSYSADPTQLGSLIIHYRDPHGELTSITGVSHYKLTSLGEFSFTDLDAIDGVNGSKNLSLSQEIRYATKFTGPLNGLIGGYYQYGDYSVVEAASLFPKSIEMSDFTINHRTDQRSNSFATFGELEWTVVPTVEIDGGVRYTHEVKRSYLQNLPNPGMIPSLAAVFSPNLRFNAAQTFDNVSPQATITWRPSADFMAFGSYKTGFLSGGFNHLAVVTIATQPSDLVFNSESAQGGEIGVKFAALDRRVRVSADAYYYRYSNLQVNSFNPVTLAQTLVNAAQSTVKGIEGEAQWNLGGGFSLAGSVNYNRARYDRYIGPCRPTTPALCTVPVGGGQFGENFAGEPTDFAPDWSGRVQIEYNHQFGGDVGLDVAAGVSPSSSYVLANVLTEPAHTLVDGHISLTHGRWEGSLIGRNLLDEAICGLSGARPLATGVPPELQCYVQRGREVRLEFMVHY